MSCEDFEELIALDAPEAKAHLAHCAACRALAEEVRQTEALLRSLGDEPANDAACTALRARVLGRISRRRSWAWKAAIAAALFLLAVTGALLRPRAPQRPAPIIAEAPKPVVTAPAIPAPREVVAPPKPRVVPAAAPRPAASREETTEPMVIKFLTDDPNVVIVWLVEGNRGDSL